MTTKILRPTIFGWIATFLLLSFYAITMRLLGGTWEATWEQFQALWPYMIPLSIGFGIQVGLYIHLKRIVTHADHVMKANTATSTVGMVACCAHHLADAAPLIGLSFISSLLVQYQISILVAAILSNIIGISYMLRSIQKVRKH